jgi:hypothetical protein
MISGCDFTSGRLNFDVYSWTASLDRRIVSEFALCLCGLFLLLLLPVHEYQFEKIANHETLLIDLPLFSGGVHEGKEDLLLRFHGRQQQ